MKLEVDIDGNPEYDGLAAFPVLSTLSLFEV